MQTPLHLTPGAILAGPRSTFRSSAKYGPCEVCREHVAEVFITPTDNGTNYAFGHATCIAPLTSARGAK